MVRLTLRFSGGEVHEESRCHPAVDPISMMTSFIKLWLNFDFRLFPETYVDTYSRYSQKQERIFCPLKVGGGWWPRPDWHGYKLHHRSDWCSVDVEGFGLYFVSTGCPSFPKMSILERMFSPHFNLGYYVALATESRELRLAKFLPPNRSSFWIPRRSRLVSFGLESLFSEWRTLIHTKGFFRLATFISSHLPN